jgi:hypothetical protein
MTTLHQATELATLRETVNKLVNLYSNLESQVARITNQRLDPSVEQQLLHEEAMLSEMLLNDHAAGNFVMGHPCNMYPPVPVPVPRSPSVASLDDTAWHSRLARPEMCLAASSEPMVAARRSPKRKPRHGTIASQLIGFSRRRASADGAVVQQSSSTPQYTGE